MKSHVVKSDDYITLHGIRYVKLEKAGDYVKDEVYKRIEELYEEIGKDVIAQVSAVYLSVLNKEFEFGETRLKRVFDSTKAMFKLMNDKAFNKNFNPDDCIKYVKDKFNIDVYDEE